MVKLNETIRFGKNIYLLESKNNNEYLLSDKNKVKSWIDSNFIKSNIELIKFRKPINISESFKALNEKSLNNSLIFENDYVKIIAKSILDEHFGGQIFYHGSHSNNITDFRVPAFWSTSVDFSTSYGNWIYRAQLDLGNCFDLNIKKHFNWLLTKLDFNLLFIDDEDIEHNLHTFEEYKKLASNNNWGIVEHHLDIITKHFDSAKITEQGTTNFIVFDNSRIKLLGKPTQRNLDETKIIIYTPENKYIRIYNEYKTDAIKSFLKEFKYYNYITPEKLKKNGFLEESLFYATQWKDEQGDDVFFTILKNPTKKEFNDMLKNSKNKQLRAIVGPNFNDDIYVWDAYYGTHDDIFRRYIYPDDKKIRDGFANVLFRKNDYDVWGLTFSNWFEKLGYKSSDNSTNTTPKKSRVIYTKH